MRTRFQEHRQSGAPVDLREGLTYFWRLPFLRTTIGMVAASNIAARGVPVAVIILAHQRGLSGTAIGGFIALTGATLLAGSLLSPLLRRILPMRVVLLAEFWTALVYAAFIVEPSVYVLAAALAVHAFWFPSTDSAMQAYSFTLIPDRLLGRALAASNTLAAVSAPLGPLAAGLLLTYASARAAVLVLAAPAVVAAVLGTASTTLRHLPDIPAASPAVLTCRIRRCSRDDVRSALAAAGRTGRHPRRADLTCRAGQVQELVWPTAPILRPTASTTFPPRSGPSLEEPILLRACL